MLWNPDQTPPYIVGRDPRLRQALARAASVAATDVPVLITGETGTGKELLAKMIHEQGPRARRPYVAVNCGTLSRDLADSALFGHERGAFTGAALRKVGWFEEANRGTLVLDEIGELPIELQSKLLRVLETGRLRRVGGTSDVEVDVRLIAVTWRDLRGEIGRGGFRADLFHRLSAFELALPALRDRKADIPLLVGGFLQEFASGGRPPSTLEPGVIDRLMAHDWPGNIRELRNVITRATILGGDPISVATLEIPSSGAEPEWQGRDKREREPGCTNRGDWAASTHGELRCRGSSHRLAEPGVGDRFDEGERTSTSDSVSLPGRTLAEIEKSIFAWALRRNGGSRRQAARALAVPRSTFCDRARRYGLA